MSDIDFALTPPRGTSARAAGHEYAAVDGFCRPLDSGRRGLARPPSASQEASFQAEKNASLLALFECASNDAKRIE